ncbi:HEAT repeat domain-containing protein [Calycomorphotria hydatis]|uniref:HEAT repeat protein n=1 Tax=Calycomorphotria hydatis TaxID=2528027 RepID=A0A517T7V1_9PLAN|nr:HEAT repeat domain-containing protein [Calycomorphotria hydatis]QDT64442.1 HEAT repeat protein [Calycomorphotria hydatis]
MSGPLDITIDLLKRSSGSAAENVLVPALDASRQSIREYVTDAIVERGSVRGHIELIRRLETLSETQRERLLDSTEPLEHAISHCLQHGDETLCRSGLEIIRTSGNSKFIPEVVDTMGNSQREMVQADASQALLSMVNRLYDRVSGVDGKRPSYQTQQEREKAVAVLGTACFERELPQSELIVESLLSLGIPSDKQIAQVFKRSDSQIKDVAGKLILESKHPGVMQLVLDYLPHRYPPPKVMEALKTRNDLEFISHLLRGLPEEIDPQRLVNLHQLDYVDWLKYDRERLLQLPDELQGRISPFVDATNIPDAEKRELSEWLVTEASVTARRSCDRTFDRLGPRKTQEVLENSLHSENEEVVAWALGELRKNHVPDALRVLVTQLDNDSEVVREAAREELKGFTLEHLLNNFTHLSRETCISAAQLLQKIDPNFSQTLDSMLTGQVQRTRLKALLAIDKMGMVAQFRQSIFILLDDPESLTRRSAVEVLAHDMDEEVTEALEDMLEDPSPRVREAAHRSLVTRPTHQQPVMS